MNPMMPGSLMPLPMGSNHIGMQEDPSNLNYFFQGPMQLPPSSSMPANTLAPPSNFARA